MLQSLLHLEVGQRRRRCVFAYRLLHGRAIALRGRQQQLRAQLHALLQGIGGTDLRQQLRGLRILSLRHQHVHAGLIDIITTAQDLCLGQRPGRKLRLVGGDLYPHQVDQRIQAQRILRHRSRTRIGFGLAELVGLQQVPGRVGQPRERIRIDLGQRAPVLQRPATGLQLGHPGLQVQPLAWRQAILQVQRVLHGFARAPPFLDARMQLGHAHVGQGKTGIDVDRGLVEVACFFEATLTQCALGQRERTQCAQVLGRGARQRQGLLQAGHRLAQSATQATDHVVHGEHHLVGSIGGGGEGLDHLATARCGNIDGQLVATDLLPHGRQQHRACALTHRHIDRGIAVEPGIARKPRHFQAFADLAFRQHVHVARLFQRDPDRVPHRVIEDRIAGEVVDIAKHHPVTLGEGNGRLRPQQQPAAQHGRGKDQAFGGQHQRLPPQRQVAARLGVGARHAQRRRTDLAHFDHFLHHRHALEAPAPVRFPQQARATLAQCIGGTAGQRFGHRRQQDLAGAGQHHQARRHRLGQAFHLHRLGTGTDRLGTVLPGQHVAHVQAGARAQFNRALLAQRVQFALVVQGEAQCVDGALEQHEQAIGAIDQLAVPALLQHQYQAIVFLEQACRRHIADPLDQLQRITQIGEQQGAQLWAMRG